VFLISIISLSVGPFSLIALTIPETPLIGEEGLTIWPCPLIGDGENDLQKERELDFYFS
jgi:hypothetical protein